MEKAILSRVKLDRYETFLSIEFNDCVGDLLQLEDIQKLAGFSQHFHTNRLQHSVNVAYYSYLVCKLLHFDFHSAARAGLLHDLFLYDWRQEKQPEGNHAQAHPKIALRTAKKNIALNKVEEDAILKHMWPLTLAFPRYKESMVVSMVDKYCALCEVTGSVSHMLYTKVAWIENIYTGSVWAR